MEQKQGLFNSALDRINAGKDGLNEGLYMGFPRMTKYVPNIQRGTYYLLGGNTGAGKSAFADEAFLFNPYEQLLSESIDALKNFKVIYYSFEIDKVAKIIKAIARRIYLEFGVLVDVNYILSRGKNRINTELYEKVVGLREYFEPLEDILEIFDLSKSPSEIKTFLRTLAKERGKITYRDWVDDRNIKHKEFVNYKPHNPEEYVEIVIDHIALGTEEDGQDTKKMIDSISQLMVPVRNNYNHIPIIIQQLTFESSSANRMKSSTKEPLLADFGDSKYTTRDANIVMSLFNPFTFEMPEYKNYDISRLRDRFRAVKILKNRDGEANKVLGMQFIGEVGNFTEMPKANDIEALEEKYEEIQDLDKLKIKQNE